MQQAFQTKSPIKISGAKRLPKTSYSNDDDEFKITKKSKIMPSSSIDYEYNEEITSKLHTVTEALQTDIYKSINVLAKVMTKDENKQVIVKQGKRLLKTSCIIADSNDSIELVLWEDHISMVDCGKMYQFKAVKVRVFDDTKYLSTNEATVIEQKDDLKDVNLSSDIIKDNIIEGKCIAAMIKKSLSCLVCNASIDLIPDEDTVTCQMCQMTMISSSVNEKLVATLVIQTNKKMETYTCFNDSLQSFLVSIGKKESINEIPTEDLKNLLLQSEQKQMIADKANKKIDQFLL